MKYTCLMMLSVCMMISYCAEPPVHVANPLKYSREELYEIDQGSPQHQRKKYIQLHAPLVAEIESAMVTAKAMQAAESAAAKALKSEKAAETKNIKNNLKSSHE